MNTKFKLALLALLGFSTASCASKKAAKKSQDKEPNQVEADAIDSRIMLMYGVPGPDGDRIMTEDELRDRVEAIQGEAVNVDEEQQVVRDTIDVRPVLMYGVQFPTNDKE